MSTSWSLIAKRICACVAIIFLVLAGIAFALGWRAHHLITPSMGSNLPVGSLVVTAPLSTDELVKGDVITADIGQGRTRTHRVVDSSEDGVITQGDLNDSPDVVHVTNQTLVGKVVFSAYGLGWVLRMLPYIVGGWLIMWALTFRLEDETLASRYRSLGVFLGLSLAVILVKPLFGVALLGTENAGTDDAPYAQAHVVSTGLLPIRVEGLGENGKSSRVMTASGQDGFADAHEPTEGGGYLFQPRPAITWPWWIVLGLVVASPWLWYYLQHRWVLRKEVRTSDDNEVDDHADSSQDEHQQQEAAR